MEKEIKIALPKFKIQNKRNLNNALENMGMSDMFSRDKANFTNLFESKASNIYVSQVTILWYKPDETV